MISKTHTFQVSFFLWVLLLLSMPTKAGQWKRICVEGGVCNGEFQHSVGGGAGGYFPVDRHAAGPVVVGNEIWFQYFPTSEYLLPDYSVVSSLFRMDTETGSLAASDERALIVSDGNTVALPDGGAVTVDLRNASVLSEAGELVEQIVWTGWNDLTEFALNTNNAALTGPPIYVEGSLYIGIRGAGGSKLYRSVNGGHTWVAIPNASEIRIGDDRFNLLANPEETALWAINSEFFELSASLWESFDHGQNWKRVDDGSFPEHTVRIVHDPNGGASYALAPGGLHVSRDQGKSWEATTLSEAVHGLVFVERNEPLDRALIVGTNTGVKVSVDEGISWQNMSQGLLSIPHTVTYANGVLVATSDAGYFTCNTVDCAGVSQPVTSPEDRGLVTVIEFFNTDLEHYFITSSEAEAEGIDQGSAGAGWIRTGETFPAWSLLGSQKANPVCRFYGSLSPGPNSHFFTFSPNECGFLQERQETTPASKPRWNFEGYDFMAIPFLLEDESCPADTQPVYRAYNDGFRQGKDSNHRYVTDFSLLAPLVTQGWIDEGIAFCVPE